MFYIIGVAHRVQSKKDDAEESDDQRQFSLSLRAAIEKLSPLLIAEEFSEHALNKLTREQGSEHRSVTKAIAESCKVDHRFCDPDAETRTRLGYVEGSQLALQIAMSDETGLSNAEVNERGFALEVAKYWPVREKFWLDQLEDVKSENVIFVCGDSHVDTFCKLLMQNGIESEIIARHIGVTQSDDELCNRIMKYLEAHPELRD